MSNQPEALMLADELADYSEGPYTAVVLEQAAAELRRLHAENEELRRCAEVEEVEKYAAANRRLYALNGELLESLKECLNCEFAVTDKAAISKARAAIAKAEGA